MNALALKKIWHSAQYYKRQGQLDHARRLETLYNQQYKLMKATPYSEVV